MNLEGYTPAALRSEELPTEDRWILSRLATITAEVTAQLEQFHFSEAARTIYDFTWSEFCDWYVEMSKGGCASPAAAAGSACAGGCARHDLRLVHPIMPFVSESIWQALADTAFERGLPNPEPPRRACALRLASIPDGLGRSRDGSAHGRMQNLVRGVREVRNRPGIDKHTVLDVFVRCSAAVAEDFQGLAVVPAAAGWCRQTGVRSGT